MQANLHDVFSIAVQTSQCSLSGSPPPESLPSCRLPYSQALRPHAAAPFLRLSHTVLARYLIARLMFWNCFNTVICKFRSCNSFLYLLLLLGSSIENQAMSSRRLTVKIITRPWLALTIPVVGNKITVSAPSPSLFLSPSFPPSFQEPVRRQEALVSMAIQVRRAVQRRSAFISA